MPFTGQEKKDDNFVRTRMNRQLEEWPRWFKGDLTGSEKLDPEIQACLADPDKRFRSEGLPLYDSDKDRPCLWRLYTGTQGVSEEEESRGKKKDKETTVVPIKARRVVGHEVKDKDGEPNGEWSYNSIQLLDSKGRPNGQFNAYDGLHFHDSGYLSFQDWLFARDQARKDLLWLNIAVLGNTLMMQRTHQIMCDQFVQKNFDGVYRNNYSLDSVQSAIRRQNRVPFRWFADAKQYIEDPTEIEEIDNQQRFMLLLYPRAFFKSTMNRADAIQWMLACPDVSIMIMTAARDLAETFVKQIKREFFLPKGGTPKPLQLLFPEYILRGVDGTSAEDLICPARRHDRPFPTLWADSIDSTLSGWHCDIIKFDDVISNTNGLTDITRTKLKDAIGNTLNLCDTWGKIDMLGTRYFPNDYYGDRIAARLKDREAGGMKYLVGAAWQVKPEHITLSKKKMRDLEEHMVVLLFPEHATFKYLRAMLLENERTFRCQQLNEPVFGDNFSIYFGEVELKQAIVNPYEAQHWRGDTYALWDTAKEAKKNSDYTVGVVARVFQRPDGAVCVVILKVVYNKWTQTETADQIALLNKEWNPRVCQIEDTGGLEAFKLLVRNKSIQACGYPPNIYWKPVSNEENAKRNRVKSLEILLKAQRLYFANGSWLEEQDGVFPQLMQFSGEKSTRTRKDDIPDAMSFIMDYLPSSAPMTPEQREEKLKQDEIVYKNWALWENKRRIFGETGRGTDTVPTMPDIVQPDPTPVDAISNRIFGNNGMRA